MSNPIKVQEEYVKMRIHSVFGKNYEGEPICANPSQPVDLNTVTGNSYLSAEDMRLEVMCAEVQEDVACAEQHYLKLIREKLGDTGPEWTQADDILAMDAHATFGRKIEDQAKTLPRANVAIVSPIALTILQSSRHAHFYRNVGEEPKTIGSLQTVGHLGALKVVVNCYAEDSYPVLIGYVPVDHMKRKANYLYRKLYLHEGFDEGWTQVRVNVGSLTFY